LIKGTQSSKQKSSSGRKSNATTTGDSEASMVGNIFDVMRKNDVALLEDYLSLASLVDVNMRNSEGFSVLHLACKV
jgi:hypothetical protein